MINQQKQKPLKFGVFGTGIMGRNHIATCKGISDIDVVGVYDVINDSAQKAAKDFGCEYFSDKDDLASKIDCAIVATTSVYHAEAALPLLEKGISCLIEKPLAATEKECEKLIETAAKNNATLMVGHIEHFNPAITKLFEIVGKGVSPLSIETRRMSAASGRITDVDVAMDLMIHDMEIILALAGSKVRTVEASSVKKGKTAGKDHITAMIEFENGVTANAVASRITTNRIRTLALTAEECYFDLDFITQKLSVNYQGRTPFLASDLPEWAKLNVGVTTEQLFVPFAQPLAIEIKHFVDCVINNKKPLVSGEEALQALKIIWEVQKKLGI
ncbi:MAG: Gfo/Idh/MocA family oxidoreductase [Alphaproteobacteria bacterium]